MNFTRLNIHEAINMAAASRNEFKLIGPSGTEKYNRSAVTLTCHLPPEISAHNLEIRWFKETDCVCVYKNRQVTEGRGYEGRVSLFTQELERGRRWFFRLREIGNASLKLKDCKESDFGHYLCQVTDGDRTNEITVAVWPRTPLEKDDECLYISQRDREWTEDERMKMKISASQIDHLRDRFERMGLRPMSPLEEEWDNDEKETSSSSREELMRQRKRRKLRALELAEERHMLLREKLKATSAPELEAEPRKRRNSTDGERPNMSEEYPTEDVPVEKTLQKTPSLS